MKILVIGGNGCSYCKIAQNLLNKTKLSYEYLNVHTDENALLKLRELGLSKIPQVFIDDKHIGGSVELHAFLKETNLLNGE